MFAVQTQTQETATWRKGPDHLTLLYATLGHERGNEFATLKPPLAHSHHKKKKMQLISSNCDRFHDCTRSDTLPCWSETGCFLTVNLREADAGEDDGHVASCSSRRCRFVTKVGGSSRPGFRCPFPHSALKILSTHSSPRCPESYACVRERARERETRPPPPLFGGITHVSFAVIPRATRGGHSRTDAAKSLQQTQLPVVIASLAGLSHTHIMVRWLARVRVALGNQTARYAFASGFTHGCAA